MFPEKAQRLVPRKCHLLLPSSSWQAQPCTPPFPFSSLSAAEGWDADIHFPPPNLPPCPPPCPLWLQEAVKLFLMSWHSAWLLLLEGKHLLACSARMLTKEKNHCPTQGGSREGQSPQPGAPLILTWTPVLSCPSESQLSLQ